MPSIRPFSRIFPLLICVSCLPALAAPATEVTTTFKIANNYLIVVPVTINGSGPYDFVLDTGSNNTMLDQKLADDLALPRGGETAILGVKGSTSLAAVYANSLSIAGAAVNGKDLFLFTNPKLQSLPAGLRGILGEDFLQHFDVLIDYRHQTIQLESAPSLAPTSLTPDSMAHVSMAPVSLALTLNGEHLPVQLSGTRRGKPTFGRLILTGRIHEMGETAISLLLDSGVNNLTLFREHLGPGSNRQAFLDASALRSSAISTMETKTIRKLNLGQNEVNDLTVIAAGDRQEPDVEGLIPTSLFHSIFISHQGKFVILNPSVSKARR
jgi:predicted aspartyl protease